MAVKEMYDIDVSVRSQVLEWLGEGYDDATKKAVLDMVQHNQKELIDSFYTTLSFGTGGLRGIMGVGTNRMNVYTVRKATQGLANYLKKCFHEEIKVVIGFDSRHNSELFAKESASVLAANGITVYLFTELRPTPVISFATRLQQAHAAIMITASHNPPEYNGYKVYWNDGGQVLPPHDKGIISEVGKIAHQMDIKTTSFKDPHIHFLGTEVDERYFEALAKNNLKLSKEPKQLKILYSSLHGTGVTCVPEALKRYGFSLVDLLKEQCVPDGNFPTAPSPNPEEEKALALGMQTLVEKGYDIFIATDPDCDRMGVVVRKDDRAVALSGNQVAALCVHAVCSTLSQEECVQAGFLKTIVTTELFRAIVEKFGGTVTDVLPGFKYIAEKIRLWESESKGKKFIFGAEESYGYLLGTHARDKDAVIASCLISELASYYKEQGKSLVDALEELYSEYGYYYEKQVSLKFSDGKEGKEAQAAVLQKVRNMPFTVLQGKKVVDVVDLLPEKNRYNLPSSNVLIFTLEDNSKVILRPSGTEPKMKIYLMLYGAPTGNMEQVKNAVIKEGIALEHELRELLV